MVRSFDTFSYWENRYKKGGHSGAGSYGTVARLKSDFITKFIRKHDIKTMVEYGCGDGHNLWLITRDNPDLRVTGVDISHTALDMCRKKMPQHTFVHKDNLALPSPPDLVVSLEVIFHLIEDEVYEEYMKAITSLGATWLVVLSPDHDGPQHHHHVKKRRYSDHSFLQDKYELVEEAELGSETCFSAWKIFRARSAAWRSEIPIPL